MSNDTLLENITVALIAYYMLSGKFDHMTAAQIRDIAERDVAMITTLHEVDTECDDAAIADKYSLIDEHGYVWRV